MELIRLFAQIAMMRKSPEEVPASVATTSLVIDRQPGARTEAWVPTLARTKPGC